MTIIDILPECYVDTNVVNSLLTLPSNTSANHCHSCNKVGDSMSRSLSDQFALGIIDNDKRQHSYMKEFQSLRRLEHIELLKHTKRAHYIIRVNPAMEVFLLDVAKAENVDLAEYGLPSELKALSRITKDLTAKDAGNVKRLVRRLSSNTEMQTMKAILVYLHTHRYNVNDDELKAL